MNYEIVEVEIRNTDFVNASGLIPWLQAAFIGQPKVAHQLLDEMANGRFTEEGREAILRKLTPTSFSANGATFWLPSYWMVEND